MAKSDLPVLKRIGIPLEIAKIGEVMVLRDDWKMQPLSGGDDCCPTSGKCGPYGASQRNCGLPKGQ